MDTSTTEFEVLTKDELDYLGEQFYRHFPPETLSTLLDTLQSKEMVCESYYTKEGLVTEFKLNKRDPSLKVVGTRNGVGPERIRQIVCKAFRIMRIHEKTFENWCKNRGPYQQARYEKWVLEQGKVIFDKIVHHFLNGESLEMVVLMVTIGEKHFPKMFAQIANPALCVRIMEKYYTMKGDSSYEKFRELVRRASHDWARSIP
jgi:uncharacterized protein YbcV (DUF1398 family)